ncbi:hypothetical protein JCM24511_09870 [Saitozyma sp. JCM 24511]|nr:hypothetical protein JCM24511_09870 [Saitozyma sp. JCM 24511]
MGNCFSDPSPKGGQRLGGADSRPSGPTSGAVGSAGSAAAKGSGSGAGRTGAPPRTLGAGGEAESGDPRDRALRAAEERAKTAQSKGVTSSNPKSGQLSAKLAAERKSPVANQNEERMMASRGWTGSAC